MKYAICNELFENWPWEKVCQTVAALGYTGLEVAPFTLAPLVTEISDTQRRQHRQQAADAGLQIIGLHWLLAKTAGFHLNSADAAIRRQTAEYLTALVHCCADLGGELLVFGSPAARKIPSGATFEDALEYAANTIRQITGALADRNIRFCIEPLAPTETDFLQTASEGERLMRLIDHPQVCLHLDVKAMSSEKVPIPTLIERHAPWTGHFHANDPNLRGPGMGKVDFLPIFRALENVGYSGWVSVEVFDFTPDPVTIARESLQYMRAIEAKLAKP